jgi:hypothetical protein
VVFSLQFAAAATWCGDHNSPMKEGNPVKNLFVLSLALSVAFALSSAVTADDAAKKNAEVKSGPQEGDHLGPFTVVKVAGAEEDGVEAGKDLCYRCRNGNKPQVIVFTRSTDKKVAELVSKLDQAVEDNASSKLCVFVNLLGEDKDALSDEAKKFAASSKAKNIPFVVPSEFENGPDDYGINAKAEVTITLASELGVKASHAFTSASDINVDAVLKDLAKIIE